MNRFVPRCATPHAPGSGEEAELLAYVFQRAVLQKIGKSIDGHTAEGRAFQELVIPACQRVKPTSSSWQPEIGAALTASRRGATKSAVMHSLFALHAIGQPGHWVLSLDAPVRHSLGGHFFDLNGTVEVDATASSVHITCKREDGRETLSFSVLDGAWHVENATAVGASWKYVGPERVDFPGFEPLYLQAWREPAGSELLTDIVIDWPPSPPDGKPAMGEASKQVHLALQTLSQADPVYVDWIRPLWRGMACTPLLRDGMRQSGSYVEHPGVFNCGLPTPAEPLAEVIVHEVSHQYLMLLSAVVPLVDDKSGEIYYSSLKGRARTLDRVLLAYHACANMTLYWLDLVANEVNTVPRDDELDIMLQHTRELAKVLLTSNGLTEAGHELVQTQRLALAERGCCLEV